MAQKLSGHHDKKSDAPFVCESISRTGTETGGERVAVDDDVIVGTGVAVTEDAHGVLVPLAN